MAAADAEPLQQERIPPGVHLVDDVRPLARVFPDIKVRGRRQTDGDPPMFARSRFAWNAGEVSGSLGDLGTFLPHIVGAITVVGMAPTGILTTFGLFYALSGAFYGVPMAVQPMKAASAAALSRWSRARLPGLELSSHRRFLPADRCNRPGQPHCAYPARDRSGRPSARPLAAACRTWRAPDGKAALAWRRYFGVHAAADALQARARGPCGRDCWHHRWAGSPHLDFGLHLPRLVVPSWTQIVHGTQNAVLPQIPLTLTNAIIVTAAVSRQFFPKELHPVTERNLAITTGLGNLLAAPFGGYLMCHGAGGIAGHVRFGARTATAPVLIGLVFVVLGLGFGDSGYALLKTIPDAVLGGLLLFSGIELALSSKLQEYRDADLFLVLLMAAIAVAFNPAAAFIVGVPLAFAAKRRWLKV